MLKQLNKNNCRTRGMTLFEILLVLVILSVAATYQIRKTVRDGEMQEAASVGDQIATVAKAVDSYIVNNAVTLQTAPTTAVTIAMLQAQTLLPANYETTNLYGSGYSILLRRVGAPGAYNIEGLVVTTAPWNDLSGGQPRMDLAGTAAQRVGGDGGSTLDGTTMTGQGWTETKANYPAIIAPAQIGVRVGFGTSQFNQFLYRDGHLPMTGNLDMGGNMLGNLAVTTPNTACVTNGTIAVAADYKVLSCQGGVWQQQGSQYWKDPVANFAARPLVGNNIGDVRVTLDTSRAFEWNGAAWVPLAADQNGNFKVPGNVEGSTLTPDLVIVPNTACPPGTVQGTMAKSNTGAIYSCQSGIWKSVTGTSGTIATSIALANSLDGTVVYVYGQIAGGTYLIGTVSFSGGNMTVSPVTSAIITYGNGGSAGGDGYSMRSWMGLAAELVNIQGLQDSSTGWPYGGTATFVSNANPTAFFPTAYGVLGTYNGSNGAMTAVQISPIGLSAIATNFTGYVYYYPYYSYWDGTAVTCGPSGGQSVFASSDQLYTYRGTAFSVTIPAPLVCSGSLGVSG